MGRLTTMPASPRGGRAQRTSFPVVAAQAERLVTLMNPQPARGKVPPGPRHPRRREPKLFRPRVRHRGLLRPASGRGDVIRQLTAIERSANLRKGPTPFRGKALQVRLHLCRAEGFMWEFLQ